MQGLSLENTALLLWVWQTSFWPPPFSRPTWKEGNKDKKTGWQTLAPRQALRPLQARAAEERLTMSRYRSWNLPCFATPRTCVVTLDPRKRQAVLQGSFARQSGLFGDHLMFQAMKRGCFVFFLNMDSLERWHWRSSLCLSCQMECAPMPNACAPHKTTKQKPTTTKHCSAVFQGRENSTQY